MTAPDDSAPSRPISVAELLAKNGTIGSPPVSGRRRRRRGNSDAVTVAELTGEIPVVSDEAEPAPEPVAEPAPDPLTDTAVVAPVVDPDPVDDYDAHLASREADPDPVEFRPRPRRGQAKRAPRDFRPSGTGAERMSPDPHYDFPADDLTADPEFDAVTPEPADLDEDDGPYSSLGSSLGALFGGDSLADEDLASGKAVDSDIADTRNGFDEADDFDDTFDDTFDGGSDSRLLRGVRIVGQCLIAVAFGAGLFIAFDQLWKWNTVVALILGVLVILGLAGGVRVVRKTEDIGSTLTAVAVGALVTFGPLALLQAS